MALRTNEQDAGSFEDPPEAVDALDAVDAVAADAVLAEAVGGGDAPLSEPPLVKIAADVLATASDCYSYPTLRVAVLLTRIAFFNCFCS